MRLRSEQSGIGLHSPERDGRRNLRNSLPVRFELVGVAARRARALRGGWLWSCLPAWLQPAQPARDAGPDFGHNWSGSRFDSEWRHGRASRGAPFAPLMHAGSSMSAQVVIDNATGHPILDLTGCGSLFAVPLAPPGYRPQVVWPTCAGPIVVPEGRSVDPVSVLASYLACSSGARFHPPCPPVFPAAHFHRLGPVDLVGEYERIPGRLPVEHRHASLELAAPVVRQHLDSQRVQSHHPRRVVLRRLLGDLGADLGKCAGNPDRGLVKVDVGPPEGTQLALAGPGRHRQPAERAELGVGLRAATSSRVTILHRRRGDLPRVRSRRRRLHHQVAGQLALGGSRS